MNISTYTHMYVISFQKFSQSSKTHLYVLQIFTFHHLQKHPIILHNLSTVPPPIPIFATQRINRPLGTWIRKYGLESTRKEWQSARWRCQDEAIDRLWISTITNDRHPWHTNETKAAGVSWLTEKSRRKRGRGGEGRKEKKKIWKSKDLIADRWRELRG